MEISASRRCNFVALGCAIQSTTARRRKLTACQAQGEPSLPQFGQLNSGIARFYDDSSHLWESMWGEHMHHGYYLPDNPAQTDREAQVEMIERALGFAGVDQAANMIDVGCGIGGSSRYICNKFACGGEGVTLSPFQAGRANELTEAAGMSGKLKYQVGDALQLPQGDGAFDLVWSMESGEHMPDKTRFVKELARVAAPGGHVIVVTWCHRVLSPGEGSLTPPEQFLLDRICDAYYLPQWCTVEDYSQLMEAEGLVEIRKADWSQAVAPFWDRVIASALTLEGVTGLLQAGFETIRGAAVMPLMKLGFEIGLVRFVIITAKKPESS